MKTLPVILTSLLLAPLGTLHAAELVAFPKATRWGWIGARFSIRCRAVPREGAVR